MLAFLSFELQIAQQRLRETFTESPVPAKALNLNALSGRAIHDAVIRLLFLYPSALLRRRSASRRILPYDRSKITRGIPRDDLGSRTEEVK